MGNSPLHICAANNFYVLLNFFLSIPGVNFKVTSGA